jgi:hypothetical protein
MPPVLGYRVLAPLYYAEMLPAAGDELVGAEAVANPLGNLDAGAPGPLRDGALLPASSARLADGDQIAAEPAVTDRSFWYLVLAGYLPPQAAHQASQAMVEASITLANRNGVSCSYATFGGTDVDATALVRGALEGWAAAVPAEFAAATAVLDDGDLQLTTCDPGPSFESGARFGIARELIGFRMAQLAVASTLSGTASEADLALALAQLDAAGGGVELAALPFETGVADFVVAANTTAAAILAPPAVEPPAPAIDGG